MSLSKMINWSQPRDTDLQKCEWKFGQFIVRVLRNDEKDEAMNLIKELIRIRDDPIISALRFDDVSKDSLINYIKNHDQNITFGCFLKPKKIQVKSVTKSHSHQGETPGTSNMKQEGGPVISDMEDVWTKPVLVAVDALYVRNIRDQIPEPGQDAGNAFINWMTYTKIIEREVWSMGNQDICNILTSFGVFVSAGYKDRGIPKEMIKNRKNLARVLWIDVTGAAIIGKEEQEATVVNKYEVLHAFGNEDSKKLGLEKISAVDFKRVFPIAVLGFKKAYKKKRTLAQVHNAHKRQKTDNN